MTHENNTYNPEEQVIDPIDQLIILLAKKSLDTFSSEVGGIPLEPYQVVLNSLPVDSSENELARAELAQKLAQVLSEERIFEKRKRWGSRAVLLYNALNLAAELKETNYLYESLERLRISGKVKGEYKRVKLVDLLEKALAANRPPQLPQEPKRNFFSRFNDIIIG